ncbi:hypothetical protein EXIGLDRAFT_765725 [Exidia glandulosa HHB12029]|uniref:Uncharacterized protein n=1 Tax=Exidia glandulosa HHB12029 TaxID=1314781 RepID=A0A165KAA4_EXIGL|nr:hypothetical protein EXIGLDRAFT_765725 [Exidia glandulosa HHB12029]
MGITPIDQDVHVNYNDPNVLYLPPTYWNDNVSGGNTGIKVSYDITAHLLFNFTGSHIWYYGDLYPDHGKCSFAIDDNTPAVFTTFSPGFLPVRLLWEQDVTPGPHVLKITNLEDRKAATVASLM